jgi:hypothetical protein
MRETLYSLGGPMPAATIFLLWADIAQAAGDRLRAQLYIECAFAAIDREQAASPRRASYEVLARA